MNDSDWYSGAIFTREHVLHSEFGPTSPEDQVTQPKDVQLDRLFLRILFCSGSHAIDLKVT